MCVIESRKKTLLLKILVWSFTNIKYKRVRRCYWKKESSMYTI